MEKIEMRRIGILAVVFFLMGVSFVAIRRMSRPSNLKEEIARQTMQDAILASWEVASIAPLGGPEFKVEMRKMMASPCHGTSLNERATVDFESLPPGAEEKLVDAISNLCVALGEDNADLLLNLMNESGMRIKKQKVEVMRKALSDKADIDLLSEEDLYRLYWKLKYKQFHWKWAGLVLGPNCMALHTVDANNDSVLQNVEDLTLTVPKTWNGVIKMNSSFESTAPSGQGQVIYADVELVISHDFQKSISPYLLRMVFNPESETWEPRLLAQILSSQDLPTMGVF